MTQDILAVLRYRCPLHNWEGKMEEVVLHLTKEHGLTWEEATMQLDTARIDYVRATYSRLAKRGLVPDA